MLGGLLGILGAAVVALVVTTVYQRGHGHRMGARNPVTLVIAVVAALALIAVGVLLLNS